MTQAEIISAIAHWAGNLRAKSFTEAAEYVLRNKPRIIIETGCYRGITGDGQSTLIFACLAKEISATFISIDIDPNHCESARQLLLVHGLRDYCKFVQGDSLLSFPHGMTPEYNVGFAYLDSFDHDQANPGPCQRHQLAEIGALWSILAEHCAILLDDNVKETGGKTKLAAPFLLDHGFKLVHESYQMMFTR